MTCSVNNHWPGLDAVCFLLARFCETFPRAFQGVSISGNKIFYFNDCFFNSWSVSFSCQGLSLGLCTGMFAASGDLIKLHSELCRPLTMGADIRIVLHLEHIAYSLTVTGTEIKVCKLYFAA